MSERLMYIWDDKELQADRVRADRRVAMARGLGFQVTAVANRSYRRPTHLMKLESQVREYDGLWIDLPSVDMGVNTRSLIGAAAEAGVKLLGHVPTDGRVVENIGIFIGQPTDAEAT